MGKTSLIRRCVDATWPDQWQLHIPLKHTTRPARIGEEAEYITISNSDFSKNSKENVYIIEYTLFGYRYGIPRAPFDQGMQRKVIYVQTYPTDVSRELILKLGNSWKSYVCVLEADLPVVRSRLDQRSDSHTRNTVEQRLATADRDRRYLADTVMWANGSAEEVFGNFLAWAVTTLTYADPS